MLEMTANELLEDDDDDFFAEAIRSIAELESTSSKIDKQNSSEDNSKIKKEQWFTLGASSDSSSLSVITTEMKGSSSAQNFLAEIKNTPKKENVIQNIINSVSLEKNNFLDQRFTPGFTPEAKKRKYPGPVGALIDEYSDETSSNNISPKKLSIEETESQTITSSQFSVEELLQSLSWQKLQEDVSSNSSFLSTAKHFSIQRVLSDIAKKKLPKHIIAPVLCIYIKKLNLEEDSTSIFMDDTGEIDGKISKDAFLSYSHFLKTGTSLIVKKVPFMCGLMLLEKTNLVSLYLEDGSVQQIQNLDSALEKEESSKPLNCICPVTPKGKISMPIKHKTISSQKLKSVCSNRSHTEHSNNDSNNQSVLFTHHTVSSDPDMETEVMDDFDELLGNLDEKSFLGEF